MSGPLLRSRAAAILCAVFVFYTASTLVAVAQDVANDRAPDAAPPADVLDAASAAAAREIAEAKQALVSDPALAEYYGRREKTPQTLSGQLQLARWCQRGGLAAQTRAHYHAALGFDHGHKEARRALGFVKLGREWIHEDDLQRLREQRQAHREALRHWQPIAVDIRNGFRSPLPKKNEAAAERLRAIDSPEAIPALEWALAGEGRSTSQQALDVIARMEGKEASASIARHAVFSEWIEVRSAAVEHLRNRPADEYAPVLVGLLSTPLETQLEVAATPDGKRYYRHLIYREGPRARYLTIAEMEAAPHWKMAIRLGSRVDGGFTSRRSQALAAQSVERQLDAQQQAIQLANESIAEVNDRVTWVLKRLTGEDLGNDPIPWWNYLAYYAPYASSAKPLQADFQRTGTLYYPPG